MEKAPGAEQTTNNDRLFHNGRHSNVVCGEGAQCYQTTGALSHRG
jgi:hypothetical protein